MRWMKLIIWNSRRKWKSNSSKEEFHSAITGSTVGPFGSNSFAAKNAPKRPTLESVFFSSSSKYTCKYLISRTRNAEIFLRGNGGSNWTSVVLKLPRSRRMIVKTEEKKLKRTNNICTWSDNRLEEWESAKTKGAKLFSLASRQRSKVTRTNFKVIAKFKINTLPVESLFANNVINFKHRYVDSLAVPFASSELFIGKL